MAFSTSDIIPVRLKCADKRSFGPYDVDRVALEMWPDGTLGDFRFELGQGYFIYWAFPAEPGGRLRLFLVDCAVAEVDTVLEEDPFLIDFPEETWRGDLHRIGEYTVAEVVVASSAGAYRVDVSVRDAIGEVRSYSLRGS